MSDKLARTLQRFQVKIDNGSFYEAHQTLRTIVNRYVKSKQYDEALGLIYQGSIILSKNKEYTSSSDLIVYLLEIYKESGKTINDKHSKDTLIELISYIPSTEPTVADLSKLAVDWSKDSTNKFGDGDLHDLFGNKFINSVQSTKDVSQKQKVFSVAELHLILGNTNSLNTYSDFLAEWAISSDQDPGVFIGRTVINYAYLKNIESVNQALTKFLSKLIIAKPSYQEIIQDGHTIYYYSDYSMINFIQLLAITLTKKDAGTKFVKLLETYKADLQSCQLLTPVEYLGRFYFNLQIGNPQGNSNMLANLMGDLFK